MARCVILALLLVREASPCSIIAVGKDASATGYPVVTHTDDGGPANDVRLVRVPRKQWPEGSVRNIYHWQDAFPRVVSSNFKTPDYAPQPGQMESIPMGSIPQVEETWAYWDVDYGMQNEWGLSIGESTGNAKTAGWPALPGTPYGKNLMGIEDLSKIALERCKTAKCAAKLMGALAVEHGFYSADSGDPSNPDLADSAEILVLADTEDVWIWNCMTGKHNSSAIWAAVRIPPDHVAIVADSFSFSLNLEDPENNLYSEGVAELAEEMGWRRTEKEQPGHFDFFLAYGAELKEPAKTVTGYYVSRRIWRGYTLLAPEEGAKIDPKQTHLANGGRMPTSIAARPGSVTLEMIMSVHRDHYEGTPYDLTKGMAAGPWGNPNRQDMPGPGQWERAFSLTRTILSYVLEPRPNGRSIAWFSYDAPHGSPYLPFYGAATDAAPSSYHSKAGDMSIFSREVAWWVFNLANTWSNLNFALINGEILRRVHEKEREALLLTKLWESDADIAEKPIPDVGIAPALAMRSSLDVLTQRSNEFAANTVAEWWEFLEHLFSKYSRMAIDYSEGDEGSTQYPSWWLDSPEVGFRTWSPDGPYHGIVCKVGQPCDSGLPRSTESAALQALKTSSSATFATETEVAEVKTVAPLLLASSPVFVASIVGALLSLSMSVGIATYLLGVRHGRREGEAQVGASYMHMAA